ncbi:MAG TPA: hypothetical protein VFN09_01715 [Rhodanobacteraceae bacterium]|nr:hypothetical protein [Rhodanobacteraceae bacterium]
MSDIIEMLETLGSNAALRHASHARLYAALGTMAVGPEAQWAVLKCDNAGLRELAGAPQSMRCLMMAPEAHLETRLDARERAA